VKRRCKCAATTLAAIGLALALVQATTGHCQSDPDAGSPGNEFYAKGDYDRAIAAFTEQIKSRHSFSDAYFNRGLCYEAKKDWKDGVADFTAVLRQHPAMYDALVERGRCYSGLSDFVNAEADFASAFELKPGKPDAYLTRGDSKFNQKKYDEAVASYTKYFDLTLADHDKIDPTVYMTRGEANYMASLPAPHSPIWRLTSLSCRQQRVPSPN